MKNIKFIFAALVSFAALSCQKESLPQSTPETNTKENLVPLVLTTGVETKTYIAANGTDVYWQTGDKIKIYSDISIVGNTANSSDFAMPEGFTPVGNFAKFEGEVIVGTSNVWAVYPSELAKTATDEGILQVSLPTSQNFHNGETCSFAQNLNISVAKAKVSLDYSFGDVSSPPVADESLTFYNVCSLLKFTVPKGVDNIKSVKITADEAIAGDMTFDYGSEKDKPEFKGVTASGSNSITMTATPSFAAGRDYYFVVAPVAITEISIFVNTTDNQQYGATTHFDAPVQLQAGKHKNLGTLNLGNMPSFGVGFDIQDEEGFLNGTNVIFTFPSPNITEVDLKVKKGETTVRSIQAKSLKLDGNNQYTSSCLEETDSTWPYLPKGTYVISGSYKADGIPVTVSGLELKIEDSPNFTVGTFKAFTSYTKYAAGAITDANACDGASIYIEQIGGISENIYRNGNYAAFFEAKFNGSENQITASYHSEVGKNRFSMPAYDKYTSAVVTFDGVASSAVSIDCHVTGIPYTLNPTTKDSSWSESGNIVWNNSGAVRLGYNLTNWGASEVASISKQFHSPTGGINVALSSTGVVEGSRLGGANLFKISVSGEQWYSEDVDKNKSEEFKCLVYKTLPSGRPQVQCINNKSTSANCSKIKTFSIIYN